VGATATGNELGNISGRAQGDRAAKFLHVSRHRHGLPIELALKSVAWAGGRELVAPFFIDQSFRNSSAEQPDGAG